MKQTYRFSRIILLVLFVAIAFSSIGYGQSAITLTSANMPLSVTSFTEEYLGPQNFASPTTGAAQTWNYSRSPVIQSSSERFFASTDNNFSASAVFDTLGFEPLISDGGSTYGIYYHNVYDQGANSITEPGISFPEQSYSLSAVSGGADDSLWVPAQDAMYTTVDGNSNAPGTYLSFPTTTGSSWSSVSVTRRENMTVRVTLLGPNKLPFQKISSFTTRDSVAGWGTLTVPPPQGLVYITRPALMVMQKQTRIDSFYLGGVAASSLILGQFGLAQGVVSYDYREKFFVEGSLLPLLTVVYLDSNYKAISGAYSEQSASSGVAQTTSDGSGMHLFPNPTNSGSFYVQLQKPLAPGDRVEIDDMTGKRVPMPPLSSSMSGTLIPASLPPGSAAGTYFVRVLDPSGVTVQDSKIEIAR